jgi:methionyl-tRNA formyltransferase
MSNYFNIAFLSSSDFTIPILQDILISQEKTLLDIIDKQLLFLKKNEIGLSPNFEYLKIQKAFDGVKKLDILQKKPKLHLIITQPDKKNRNKIISNPISKFAKENHLEVFKPLKINLEFDNIKNSLSPLDIAITASFGQIISTKILKLPKFGFINWHPSLLPKYRGASPMQAVIAAGEKKTGLSWIDMTAKMDAGEILLQTLQSLDIKTDFTLLAKKMSETGKNTWALAILSQLLRYQTNKSKFSKFSLVQEESKATFTKLLTKEDSLVNPLLMTATEIFNHYKAYQLFPKTCFLETQKFNQKLRLELVSLFESKNTEFKTIYESKQIIQVKQNKQIITLLKCKNNTFLELKRVITEQGKKIDFSGFIF